MILRTAAALALLLPALPAPAQFEGVAHVEMASGEGELGVTGKGQMFMTSAAWRVEMDLNTPTGASPAKRGGPATRQATRLVVFGKASEPRKTWMLNDRKKVYAVIEDVDRGEAPAPDWKVARAGQDKVAGIACTSVKAQREGDEEVHEACLAKDFVSGDWLKSVNESQELWLTAVQKAGFTGFPVRQVSRTRDGKVTNRFEIVKLERRKVPASMFEVPAGYRKGEPLDVMPMSAEQQQQMQEAQRQAAEHMKNMSPEQKKMMEEMMKKYGAGKK